MIKRLKKYLLRWGVFIPIAAMMVNQFFSLGWHLFAGVCAIITIGWSYFAIFKGEKIKLTQTLWYLALVYAFFSLITPLFSLYQNLLNHTVFSGFVGIVTGKLAALNASNNVLDTIMKIVISLTMLLFCREMLNWSDSVPHEEFNCYRIRELHLNRWTVVAVLSEYFFFFSYWVHGHRTYLMPLVLITLFSTVSQMILLNSSSWNEKTILHKAVGFIMSDFLTEKRVGMISMCKNIILRLGRMYIESEKKPVDYRRKGFQKDLFTLVARQSALSRYKDKPLLWCSLGMACKVSYSRNEAAEKKNTESVILLINSCQVENIQKYYMLIGLIYGHLLNRMDKSLVFNEDSKDLVGSQVLTAVTNNCRTITGDLPVLAELLGISDSSPESSPQPVRDNKEPKSEEEAGAERTGDAVDVLWEASRKYVCDCMSSRIEAEKADLAADDKNSFRALVKYYMQEKEVFS